MRASEDICIRFVICDICDRWMVSINWWGVCKCGFDDGKVLLDLFLVLDKITSRISFYLGSSLDCS